jgi:hypothetical protein
MMHGHEKSRSAIVARSRRTKRSEPLRSNPRRSQPRRSRWSEGRRPRGMRTGKTRIGAARTFGDSLVELGEKSFCLL